MTNKKPIIDKGIILYNDYDFIFNFLKDEELGKLIRILLKTHLNPTLNPTDNDNINNAYNYIANRIIDYQNKKGLYTEWGKKGGNPTLNPTDNYNLKLKEENRIEKKLNIIEDKKKEIKNKYGEFQNILLTKEEYNKLLELYKTKEGLNYAIEKLSSSIKMKGYVYKEHYLAMRENNWVYNYFIKNYKCQENNKTSINDYLYNENDNYKIN